VAVDLTSRQSVWADQDGVNVAIEGAVELIVTNDVRALAEGDSARSDLGVDNNVVDVESDGSSMAIVDDAHLVEASGDRRGGGGVGGAIDWVVEGDLVDDGLSGSRGHDDREERLGRILIVGQQTTRGATGGSTLEEEAPRSSRTQVNVLHSWNLHVTAVDGQGASGTSSTTGSQSRRSVEEGGELHFGVIVGVSLEGQPQVALVVDGWLGSDDFDEDVASARGDVEVGSNWAVQSVRGTGWRDQDERTRLSGNSLQSVAKSINAASLGDDWSTGGWSRLADNGASISAGNVEIASAGSWVEAHLSWAAELVRSRVGADEVVTAVVWVGVASGTIGTALVGASNRSFGQAGHDLVVPESASWAWSDNTNGEGFVEVEALHERVAVDGVGVGVLDVASLGAVKAEGRGVKASQWSASLGTDGEDSES